MIKTLVLIFVVVIVLLYVLCKALMKKYDVKRCDNLDVPFVIDWLSKQDLSEYNTSYTCVLLRGNELLKKKACKIPVVSKKFFCLAIFDKLSGKVVKRSFFIANTVSDAIGESEFVEFPFEA